MSADQRPVRRIDGPDGAVYLVENPSSVEISTNAKGEASFCVKVYDADPALAAKRASEILDTLRASHRKESLK